MEDLLLLCVGGLLELIAEGAATVVETRDGLIDGGHLVGGSGEAGGGVDAEHDVVECFDVAIDGQDLAGGAGGSIGGGEQGGQGGLHVVLDGANIGLGLIADGVGGLPTIKVQPGECASEDIQGRLERRGGQSCR
jgi:hypothetical protein